MDVSRNDMLERARQRRRPRADVTTWSQATEQLAQVPGPEPGPDQRPGRPDADRRGPGLPVRRAGRHVPRAQPVRGPGHGRVGRRRPRSSRLALRAGGALQPGRDLHGLRRGRARGRGLRRRSPPPRTTCSTTAGIAPEETFALGADDDGYAGAADDVGRGSRARRSRRTTRSPPRSRSTTSRSTSRSRASRTRPRLLEQFEEAVAQADVARSATSIIVDDEDERLILSASGRFRAEVLPEDGDGEWRELTAPDDIVEFYDPTDVFGDLADSLAEAFPSVAPETADDEEDEGEDDEDEGGDDEEDEDEVAEDKGAKGEGDGRLALGARGCRAPPRRGARRDAGRSARRSGCWPGTPRRSRPARAPARRPRPHRRGGRAARCAARSRSRPRMPRPAR